MFWGLIMEPGRCYTQEVKVPFHISMAALDLSNAKEEPSQVMCVYEDRNYLLCTLNKVDQYQCQLDLNFEVGTKISFAVNGSSHVHLTGYLTGLDDDMFDEEEDEEEEADEEEQQVSEKSKKKKKSQKFDENEQEQPPKKKTKTDKKLLSSPLVKQLIETADEDESDDDDFQMQEASDEEVDEEGEEEEDDDDDDEEGDEEAEEEDEDELSSLSDDDDDEEVEEEEEPAKQQAKPAAKAKQNGVVKKDAKKEKPAATPKKQTKQEAEKPAKEQKKPQQQQQPKPKKTQLKNGIVIEDLRVGNGEEAKSGRFVHVYYEGRLKDTNKLFDSTTKGPGFRFRLGKGEVIKGWDIGVAGMKVGGKRRILCPPAVAYGQKGSPPVIPPNSTLVFDVELKKIN